MDCRDDVLELPISCRDPLPYQSTAASQNPGSALALAVTGESAITPPHQHTVLMLLLYWCGSQVLLPLPRWQVQHSWSVSGIPEFYITLCLMFQFPLAMMETGGHRS